MLRHRWGGFFFEDFRPNGYFIFLKKNICFLSCEQNHLTYPSKIPPTDLVGFVGDSPVGEASVDRWSHPVSDRSRTSEIGSDPSSESESMTRPPGGDGGDCNENPLCKEWGLSNLCVSEKSSNEERDTIRNKKFWTSSQVFLHKWWRFKNDGFIRVIQLDSHRARALCTRHKFTS